jgi:hypothetical protein
LPAVQAPGLHEPRGTTVDRHRHPPGRAQDTDRGVQTTDGEVLPGAQPQLRQHADGVLKQ